ncbi:hypothetical protein L917_08468, partial [Phytophthora nicotianae]
SEEYCIPRVAHGPHTQYSGDSAKSTWQQEWTGGAAVIKWCPLYRATTSTTSSQSCHNTGNLIHGKLRAGRYRNPRAVQKDTHLEIISPTYPSTQWPSSGPALKN